MRCSNSQLVNELLESEMTIFQCCTSRSARFVMKSMLEEMKESPEFDMISEKLSASIKLNLRELMVDKFGHQVVISALSNCNADHRRVLVDELMGMQYGQKGVKMSLADYAQHEIAGNVLVHIVEKGSPSEAAAMQRALGVEPVVDQSSA
jgi:hypothetical protein